eukprot:7257214-Prymnesium_polylepis.1
MRCRSTRRTRTPASWRSHWKQSSPRRLLHPSLSGPPGRSESRRCRPCEAARAGPDALLGMPQWPRGGAETWLRANDASGSVIPNNRGATYGSPRKE